MMKDSVFDLQVQSASKGFTLIGLMIVVAVNVIILSLAIAIYSNYSVRAKIGEALYLVTEAKNAATSFCLENRSAAHLSNQRVDYNFKPAKYVHSIVVSGTCDKPIIMVTTQATGAQPDPILTVTLDSRQMRWTCVSSGLKTLTPEICQN